jgi:type IV secretory pathway TrbL component
MFDMQSLKYVLYNAGLVPDILIVGGWFYAVVLFIVLLYYFFSYVIKLLIGERK